MIPTRILFCTDFSDNSLDAQSTAVEYARTFGAKLIIVHVIDTWAGLPAYNEGAYLQAQDAFARMNESTRDRLEDMGNQCTGVSDVKTVSRTGVPSDEIVAREIEGELIIVPLASGIGDMEDELFTLNETGRAIWDLLDGKRSLREIAGELAGQYDAPEADIAEDVSGLAVELYKRRIIIDASEA